MNNIQFPEFISSLSTDFVPIVQSEFSKEDYVDIDLSENNEALNHIDVTSSLAFEHYITAYLSNNKAKVAYGGYNENRGIYRRSTHFNQQDPETERNIHLGLDLWCAAGTSVHTPLDGVIHSFKNNNNFGDYGPTIILTHTFNETTFYTLYGHLTLESISKIKIGQEVKAGEKIAILGDATVNGDYAPHLHFQIINDIEEKFGDYPGVSNKRDLDFYLKNCPDPNLLLKI
ncbi:peptidoglycan DD-metalloendopeptidase family protein [Aquimarina algicola]|uniref:Peptidase M23 n=1 Tax=Aquimarina algicola TaxID=2589995 RepID=A0A504J2N3_9FLAO|nr:peptidoglycan DD-metalloendopeptidase family protein [Aquimarina algicola]TPN84704.1 peptidase M23 [Aquimarina algicola]